MSHPRPLGRLEPPDTLHIDRYPLAALPAAQRPSAVPVALGFPWFVEFDEPHQDARSGAWWLAPDGKITKDRGGHATTALPASSVLADPLTWWAWFDQHDQPCCVGEACSRVVALTERRRMQPWWLYRQAQARDGTPGPHDGTLIRAAFEVLQARGHVGARTGEQHWLTDTELPELDARVNAAYGIRAFRWCTTADEALAALGTPRRDYIEIANSWGRDYPRRVRMHASLLDTILKTRGGEAGVITPR